MSNYGSNHQTRARTAHRIYTPGAAPFTRHRHAARRGLSLSRKSRCGACRPVPGPLARRRIQGADVGREGCVPVAAATQLEGDGRIRISELPAVESMASLVLSRQLSKPPKAYEALFTWIEANGYHVVAQTGSSIYRAVGTVARTMKPASPRFQFPVAKKRLTTDQALCPPPAGWEAFPPDV